jgi:benzoate membrane transport protein
LRLRLPGGLADAAPGLPSSAPGRARGRQLGAGLAAAMKDERQRDAALITFVASASGLTLWGVGSAFRAVVAGVLALAVQHWRIRPHGGA